MEGLVVGGGVIFRMEGYLYTLQARVLEINDYAVRVRTIDEQEGWISKGLIKHVVSPELQIAYETQPDMGIGASLNG